jgi:hypothetical protein
MQDLIRDYASDLKKLRDACHEELRATANELSKALGIYAQGTEAALASFMEKASARGLELEASATARLSQFCGLPENSSEPDVEDKPLLHTPNADVFRSVAAAEKAVADVLQVESENNPQPTARLSRILRERTLEGGHLPRQEEHIEAAHSSYVTKTM